MFSKRIREIGKAALCTFTILLLTHSAMAAEVIDSGRGEKVITNTKSDGGSGLYKAIRTGEPSLPTHTIYRPADLSPFGKKNPMPIVAWGNGGCMNDNSEFTILLTELASHGFIVIAIGQAENPNRLGETKSSQLLEAIDWAAKQNADSNSIYYQKIDTGKVALMGQSCGGLQAIEASLDPRVTTTIMWNSGVLGQMPASVGQAGAAPGGAASGSATQGAKQEGTPSGRKVNIPNFKKDDLQKLHGSILYIVGTKDIALENARDDFVKLTKLPVVLAIKIGAEHVDATYSELHAGDYGSYGSAWLKWQLKGNKEAARIFKGKDCTICKDSKWEVQKKNID